MEVKNSTERSMRILLRQQVSGLYLQVSGDWTANREGARSFSNSVEAYWWALEQALLNTDVLLAFNDENYDIVSMSV